jgi:FtsP/CotA-like multicopper oxidase with cupredoxin domain
VSAGIVCHAAGGRGHRHLATHRASDDDRRWPSKPCDRDQRHRPRAADAAEGRDHDVRLSVTNDLDEDSSIHWHGLIVPFQMDGVPGVSFPGIKPRSTFVYEFPVRQSGTYWYHSHSGLQEQIGHYGPIVIDPAGIDPIQSDREHVIVLSDWSPVHPHILLKRLKQMGGYFNSQKADAGRAARRA